MAELLLGGFLFSAADRRIHHLKEKKKKLTLTLSLLLFNDNNTGRRYKRHAHRNI